MSSMTLIRSSIPKPNGFPSDDIRQTVVIQHNGDTLVYTRDRAGRGANGAWRFDTPQFPSNEVVVGSIITQPLSALDIADLGNGILPRNGAQSIVRKGDATGDACSTYLADTVLEDAVMGNPLPTIAPTAPAQPVVAPPVGQPTIQQPVQQPVVAPPAPMPTPTIEVVERELVSAFSTLTYPSKSDPEVRDHIQRTIKGVRMFDFFDACRAEQKSVLIKGHAGVGKTSEVMAYGAERGLPVAVIQSNPAMDESQIQGELIPTPEGHFAWRNSAFADAVQQPSVVLINEATRMPAKANSMFLAPLQERKLHMTRHLGEVIPIHPDCLIIADANWGYRGVTKPDQAFLDRFEIIEYRYDRDIESKFIPSKSLLDVAFAIRDQYELGEYRSVFSTRTLKSFVWSASRFGWEFARESLLNSMEEEDRGGIATTLDLNGSNICGELGIAYTATV